MIDMVLAHIVKPESTAEGLLAKVAEILDDVADQFVFKLWQVLIFEQLKVEKGVYDSRTKLDQLKSKFN